MGAVSGCEQVKGLLGMRALGRLPEPEPPALQAHLDGCAACRAELAGLQRAGALLTRADGSRLAPPAAPPQLRRQVLGSLAGSRARSRRRALLAVPAAAAVVVLVLAVLLVGRGGPADTETVTAVAFVAVPAGVSAAAQVQDAPWGTRIHLEVAGLPSGAYQVWLQLPDGGRLPAGTFSSLGSALARVDLAAAADRSEVVALGVSRLDGDRTPVLRAPLG